MRCIGARSLIRARVGVATQSGRAYYQITSFLKQVRIPYVDVIPDAQRLSMHKNNCSAPLCNSNLLIITTRRERLQIAGNVVCLEDLGDDAGLAKQKLFSILYPLKESDWFVVGIDPGERTGLAAFMNQVEVESAVFRSIEDTLTRVQALLDNAPNMRKMVKIGAGMPKLADKLATDLGSKYDPEKVRIQLVDERGTSSLYRSGKNSFLTRDQRAAKLIAFREGIDYFSQKTKIFH